MIAHRSWKQVLPWVTAFAIAMAFLESAVVIYLRKLYYPDDFHFPLAPIDQRIAITELLREVATMIMLLAPGAMITRSRLERFAWFAFCFGVWDIFYYVFLKAILGWPTSILDWDVLFLVPVVWVGPVLAPIIVSIGLTILAFIILRKRSADPVFALARSHGFALGLCSCIMLFTFVEEPCRYLIARGGNSKQFTVSDPAAATLTQLAGYVPVHFSWPVFTFACAIGTAAMIGIARRRK